MQIHTPLVISRYRTLKLVLLSAALRHGQWPVNRVGYGSCEKAFDDAFGEWGARLWCLDMAGRSEWWEGRVPSLMLPTHVTPTPLLTFLKAHETFIVSLLQWHMGTWNDISVIPIIPRWDPAELLDQDRLVNPRRPTERPAAYGPGTWTTGATD